MWFYDQILWSGMVVIGEKYFELAQDQGEQLPNKSQPQWGFVSVAYQVDVVVYWAENSFVSRFRWNQ